MVHSRLKASAAALFFEKSCFFNVSFRCSASAAGSNPQPIAPSDLMNLETSSATSPSHPQKCQKSGRLICPDSQRTIYCWQAFMMVSGDDLSTIKHLQAEKITGFWITHGRKWTISRGLFKNPSTSMFRIAFARRFVKQWRDYSNYIYNFRKLCYVTGILEKTAKKGLTSCGKYVIISP